jgi:hypothetical protein
MAAQHTKMLNGNWDNECVVWRGMKLTDKTRPIVSGAKDLYQRAVHHADYSTAYAAQMVVFNIAAKTSFFRIGMRKMVPIGRYWRQKLRSIPSYALSNPLPDSNDDSSH